MKHPKLEIIIISLTFYLGIFSSPSFCGEVNDLWLLISSYEDIGITVQDLAFFLATHGYDAKPEKSYVTVTFSDGEDAYLTPNGGAPKLADLWATPPTYSGPVMLIPEDAIQKNTTYVTTDDRKFLKTIRRYVMFPVTPLGMCYDGSQQLAETYTSFDYRVKYMYDPSQWDWQGHLWILVEDGDHPNTWIAVDSYYGCLLYTSPSPRDS